MPSLVSVPCAISWTCHARLRRHLTYRSLLPSKASPDLHGCHRRSHRHGAASLDSGSDHRLPFVVAACQSPSPECSGLLADGWKPFKLPVPYQTLGVVYFHRFRCIDDHYLAVGLQVNISFPNLVYGEIGDVRMERRLCEDTSAFHGPR